MNSKLVLQFHQSDLNISKSSANNAFIFKASVSWKNGHNWLANKIDRTRILFILRHLKIIIQIKMTAHFKFTQKTK